MQPRSARWDATVGQSRQVVVECDVLLAGQIVAENVAIVAGKVTADRTAAIRGRLDGCQLAEPLRVPGSTLDVLGPGGYELAVRRGVRYSDGSTELMALGVFPIQRSSFSSPGLVTDVTTMDRAQLVADARLEADYSIASGTNYGLAIQALIAAGVPWLTFAFPTVTFTTPLLTLPAQTDRWEAAMSMAKSIGCEIYFDGLGRCVLRQEPDLSTAVPVWDVSEGEGGVLLSAQVDRDRQYAYNRVVATSQNSSNAAVYRGVATDDDPSSPTYYFGPFGRKPRFFSSEFLASDAQCVSAAQSILTSNIGIARSVNASAVPNEAVEAGDVFTVTREVMGLANEVHIADIISLDLSPTGAMSVQSRARQEGT